MSARLNCVLLIDDDEDDNYFHKLIIEESRAAGLIKIVSGGHEAIDYLEKEGLVPDLIFLDANMPKMNGWEFIAEYRKLPVEKKGRSVMIMLTTSLSRIDSQRASEIREIDGFEAKPLTSMTFEKILLKHFSHHDHVGEEI
jgi:CheY-like chemotaxis protein